MDKFSQLIAKGVAKFNYTPIAPEIPEQCPVCRVYNNVFGAATDTHMSCLDDGRKVITGHVISDEKKFNQFIYSSMYGGVNFTQAGFWSFTDFCQKNKMYGEYGILNGDNVYFLTPIPNEETGDCNSCPNVQVADEQGKCRDCFTTSESIIPQNLRYLSRHGDLAEVVACIDESSAIKTARNLNESINVYGNNWWVAGLKDGFHVIGYFNNKAYII